MGKEEDGEYRRGKHRRRRKGRKLGSGRTHAVIFPAQDHKSGSATFTVAAFAALAMKT